MVRAWRTRLRWWLRRPRTRELAGRAARVVAKAAAVLAVLAVIIVRPVRFLVVTGGSMAPAMSPGDVAIVARHAPVAPGDIACFSDGASLVCHRVVALADGGWTTKGDANGARDSRSADNAALLGRVVFVVRSSKLGVVAGWCALGYHRVQATAWP